MPVDNSTVIEGFILDSAFLDRSRAVNPILLDQAVDVATLTPKALSYFNQPALFTDKRVPASRVINWSASTSPQVVVDATTYDGFVTTLNGLSSSAKNGLFKMIDRLIFSYDSNTTHSQLEAALIADPDIAAIYVADSFTLSAQILTDTIYFDSGSTNQVQVPTFVKFSLNLPSGSSSITYVVTLFASSDAFISGYNISTITKVIPPLTYSQLYSASLTSTTSNIFAISADTANLNYSKSQPVLGTTSVSGVWVYPAVVVDGLGNTASVPFQVLYKGRTPTLMEIRAAVKAELLASGVGDAAGWEARIPGVFVSGRFYIVPFWDLTFQKPNQVLFPSIIHYKTISDRVSVVLESLGEQSLDAYIDVLPVYYDRMTVASVPDTSGVVDIAQLIDVIPDYQSFSPNDDNYGYMNANTREFASQLNALLTIDATGGDPGVYIPITENELTFYSIVVGKYEICIITKQCYTNLLEGIQ